MVILLSMQMKVVRVEREPTTSGMDVNALAVISRVISRVRFTSERGNVDSLLLMRIKVLTFCNSPTLSGSVVKNWARKSSVVHVATF